MKFGEYLRALRQSKGMTIKEVAKSVFLSLPYLSQIETGVRDTPSPQMIRDLSKALGVTHVGMMIKAGYLTEEEVLLYRFQNGIKD